MAEEPSAAVRELEEDELAEDGALPAKTLLDHLKLCAILHEAHDAPPRDPDTSSQVHATSADALPGGGLDLSSSEGCVWGSCPGFGSGSQGQLGKNRLKKCMSKHCRRRVVVSCLSLRRSAC